MPPAKITRQEALARITEVFRRYGYDGTTLTLLSGATGLGKASLYHHFPGGKEQMLSEVLGHVGAFVQEFVIAPLAGEGTPAERLDRHLRGVSELYDSGRRNCVFGALVLGGGADLFAEQVRGAMRAWINAVAGVARDAGIGASEARLRAEAALVRVQGALIVSRGLGTTAPFRRVLESLRDELLSDA